MMMRLTWTMKTLCMKQAPENLAYLIFMQITVTVTFTAAMSLPQNIYMLVTLNLGQIHRDMHWNPLLLLSINPRPSRKLLYE